MFNSVASGKDIVAVTKSDTVADLNGPFRGFVMDAAGAIKMHTPKGNDRVLPSGLLAANVVHWIAFSRIWSTGTGAQNIYGIY